jgi:hypothetical protein
MGWDGRPRRGLAWLAHPPPPPKMRYMNEEKATMTLTLTLTLTVTLTLTLILTLTLTLILTEKCHHENKEVYSNPLNFNLYLALDA